MKQPPCSRNPPPAVERMSTRVKGPMNMPIVPNPEDGLRTLVERATRAEAWVESMIEKLRPTFTMLYGIRRHLATGTVAVVTIWFFAHVMFGLNGMVAYRQKKAEFQSLQEQIKQLQQENVRYTEQIHSLETDPKAIEKEAREQLHYARPGEVIYVSPSPPPPAVPERRTAKK
jgi:cell division protein FtsB